MKLIEVAITCVTLLGFSTSEPPVTSQVTAQNGVPLTLAVDDFAGETYVASPRIRMRVGDHEIQSYGFIVRSTRGRAAQVYSIQGEFFTIGSGGTFANLSPILRGGESLPFRIAYRSTGQCTTVCSYYHHFVVTVSAQQMNRFLSEGQLMVQFRSPDGGFRPMLTIPAAHLQAVLAYRD